MKKIYLLFLVCIANISLMAQSMGYTDLGVLFSQENYNGTARYNAMSGAFGALGGDVSAIYHNPASGAVFSRSEISGSLSYETIDTDATYYGKTTFNNQTDFRVPQFGFVIVFDAPYSSNWSKFTLGFNYSTLNEFKRNYTAKGNNGSFVRYNLHPFDNPELPDEPIPYNIPESQTFQNNTSGRSDVYTLSIASAYKDFFYIGSTLNFHNVKFSQDVYLSEQNGDDEGNTLYADYNQFLYEESSGISLGVGMILKPFRNFRLGFAYQSPIWYPEIYEESNAIDYDLENSYSGFQERGYLDIQSTDIPGLYRNTYDNNPEFLTYKYNMNTPEKWTASAAITLGQHGLISVDYHQKNYSLIRFGNGSNFQQERDEIATSLTTARGLRGGGELRFNQISLRGGALLEESPYKPNNETFYKKGVSLGLGLKFKNAKLDFAYQYTEIDENYSIYHSSESVNDVTLLNTNSRFSTTLALLF